MSVISWQLHAAHITIQCRHLLIVTLVLSLSGVPDEKTSLLVLVQWRVWKCFQTLFWKVFQHIGSVPVLCQKCSQLAMASHWEKVSLYSLQSTSNGLHEYLCTGMFVQQSWNLECWTTLLSQGDLFHKRSQAQAIASFAECSFKLGGGI